MSLQTDRIFIYALTHNTELYNAVGKRIFSTAIPRAYYTNVDAFFEQENCPTPYLIVTFDGLANELDTKDDDYDGGTDRVNVSVEIAANSREELASLAESVRSTMDDFVRDYEPVQGEEDLTALIPSGWDFSAQAVQYDMAKPCYWQTLTYMCDTDI